MCVDTYHFVLLTRDGFTPDGERSLRDGDGSHPLVAAGDIAGAELRVGAVLPSLSVRLRVNGDDREVEDGSTVSDLVAELGYGNRQVVVELNGEPLERSRFTGVQLEAGDVIEVVRAVAGG